MFDIDKHLEELRQKWPSNIVARSEFNSFTGGAISPKTIANLESEGKGPKNKHFMGNKVVYRIDDAIDFLRSRIAFKGGEDA